MAVQDILPDSLTDEEKRLVVRRQLDVWGNTINNDNKSSLEPFTDRHRQPKEAKDINDFFDLVRRALEDKQYNHDGISANRGIVFTEEFPRKELETETISFALQSREPASMSQGRHGNGRVREWKPHVRGVDDDPNNAGYRIVTFGQKFENYITLTCWAKTNKRANKRARWLEDTLKEYAWWIKYNGIDEFYFVEQEADQILKLDGSNNIIMGRPMRYFVRTERLTHVSENTMRRIIIDLSAHDDSTSS